MQKEGVSPQTDSTNANNKRKGFSAKFKHYATNVQHTIHQIIRTENERATRAAAREEKLQLDIKKATEASKKTLQAENARQAPQAANLNSGSSHLTQALQQSNQERLLVQQAIEGQRTAVRDMLKLHGYCFWDVPRDGNCFYHALCAHYIPPEALDKLTPEIRKHLAKKIRLDTALKAQLFHSQFRYSPGLEYESGLNSRLNEDNELENMIKDGHYANLDDITFAAQLIQRPIMVIDRYGESRLVVDEKGKPVQGIDSLENAGLLNPTVNSGHTDLPLIMILDETTMNNPQGNHFMLATRKHESDSI